MTSVRSVCLRVHLGHSGAFWTLLFTDHKGVNHIDRRLHIGDIRDLEVGESPEQVLALLERAVADLRKIHPSKPSP